MENVLSNLVDRIKGSSKHVFVERKYIKDLHDYIEELQISTCDYRRRYKNVIKDNNEVYQACADKDQEIKILRASITEATKNISSTTDLIRKLSEKLVLQQNKIKELGNSLNEAIKVAKSKDLLIKELSNHKEHKETEEAPTTIEDYCKYILCETDSGKYVVFCKEHKLDPNIELCLKTFCVQKICDPNAKGRDKRAFYLYVDTEFGQISTRISKSEAEKIGFFYFFDDDIKYIRFIDDNNCVSGPYEEE